MTWLLKKNYLSQENIIYLDPMINNVELKAVEGNIDQKILVITIINLKIS